MTTTDKLINDCNLQIKELELAKLFLDLQRHHLDKFSDSSSIGISISPTLFLHQPHPGNKPVPVDDIKAFCRDATNAQPARTWAREATGNGINYKSDHQHQQGANLFSIYIFEAEPTDVTPLAL